MERLIIQIVVGYMLKVMKAQLPIITRKKEFDAIRHGKFNDSTKYQDFITAINYCFEKWPFSFAPHENDIWAMYVTVDTSNYPKEVLDKYRKKGQL